jgi:enoyl-CoA hydratase/3-hydroxyacyl-CoA dehydrogenase
MVERGVATPEGIDARVKKAGVSMGPYELMDYIGLDVSYHIARNFSDRLSRNHEPSSWLKAKVDAGELGKKTGKGIYDWSKGRPEIDLSKAKEDFDPNVFTALQVNEATKLLEEGVVKSPDDIDKAMVNGGGVAAGPFQLAREVGYDKLTKICNELAQKFGVKVFEPTKTLKRGSP